MEKRPDALLLKFAGTNCDEETARALRAVGFDAEIMPFPLVTQERIEQADLVVLAGGFSYGDYIMAGKLAQLELQQKLGAKMQEIKESKAGHNKQESVLSKPRGEGGPQSRSTQRRPAGSLSPLVCLPG